MSAKKPVGEVLKQIAEELQQYHFRPGVKKPDVIIRMVSHLLKKLPKHMRHHILVNLLTYGQARVPAEVISAYKAELEKLEQTIQNIISQLPPNARLFFKDLLNKLALMRTIYTNKEDFLKAVKQLLEQYKNIKVLSYNAVAQEVEATCRKRGLSQSTIEKILQEIKTKVFKGGDYIIIRSDKDLENVENQIANIVQKYNVPIGIEEIYVPDVVYYVLSQLNVEEVQKNKNLWPTVVQRVEQMLGGKQWIPKDQLGRLQEAITEAIREVFNIKPPSLEEIKKNLIQGIRANMYDLLSYYHINLRWLDEHIEHASSVEDIIRFLKAVLNSRLIIDRDFYGYYYYDIYVPGYGRFFLAWNYFYYRPDVYVKDAIRLTLFSIRPLIQLAQLRTLISKLIRENKVKTKKVIPSLMSIIEKERNLIYSTSEKIENIIEKNFRRLLKPLYKKVIFELNLLGWNY